MLKKVLVADDDAAILDVVNIVLTDAGYHVIHEKRGDKVMETAKEHTPQVILLDIWLSGANGQEVVKLLKANDKTKKIPVLLMSANSETEKLARECGADGFLAKPFDISELITSVEKYALLK